MITHVINETNMHLSLDTKKSSDKLIVRPLLNCEINWLLFQILRSIGHFFNYSLKKYSTIGIKLRTILFRLKEEAHCIVNFMTL